ncbi:MAG: hypothetical protein ACOVOE_06910 [Caulobacter sp.]
MTLRERIESMTLRQGVVIWLLALALGGAIRWLGREWSIPLLGLPVDFWRGFLMTTAAIPPVVAVVVPLVLGAGMRPKPTDT